MLLINRADAPDFWQSVTGSKDDVDETWRRPPCAKWPRRPASIAGRHAAARGLSDWGLENVYDIYPRWLHRYAPGVTRNTEHVFGLCVPAGTPVR